MIAQTALLLAGTLLVGALCGGGGWLLARALGRRTAFWRVQVPWTAFHGYLVVALYAGGGLPTSGRGLLLVLALTAAATALGGLVLRVGRIGGGARALFFAWLVPWALAVLLNVA